MDNTTSEQSEEIKTRISMLEYLAMKNLNLSKSETRPDYRVRYQANYRIYKSEADELRLKGGPNG